jgi:glutamate transport system permease protein
MTSVLYDEPGPVARRRVLIGSLVALVVLLAVAYVVFVRLRAEGQFEKEKWAPLLDPNDPDFSDVWELLREGLVNTLRAAVLAMAFSLAVGTLVAVLRITASPWYRWFVVTVIEIFRGIPSVIAIFFAARVLPEAGVDLSPLWYLVIGLTVYNSVIIAEVVRSGVDSLPRGQQEAAYAVGLTRAQTLRMILLPQAFRVMLPALISQLVVVLKDTSLGFIILYPELVRTGGIIVQNLRNPIQTYLVVGVIFVLVNYALSRIAVYVERRLSRSTPHTRADAPEVEDGVTVGDAR